MQTVYYNPDYEVYETVTPYGQIVPFRDNCEAAEYANKHGIPLVVDVAECVGKDE